MIFFISTALSIWYIDKKIEPVLMQIAERKTTEFATRAINAAVDFAESYDFEDVIKVTYDNEGHVATYNRNPAVVSEINRVATDRVEEFFLNVNRGDTLNFRNPLNEPYEYTDPVGDRPKTDPTLIEIPLGSVTGNSVLANLGPKIPINFDLVGTVRTNIIHKDEEFGINGAWISLYINIEADVQIIVPFTTEVTTVNTEIYIDSGAIMGKVPDFYSGEGGGPSIAIPKQDIVDNLQDD